MLNLGIMSSLRKLAWQLFPNKPTTVSTGTKPWGMCISTDGTSVYTANNIDNTISMFNRNTTTGTLTTLLSPPTLVYTGEAAGTYAGSVNTNTNIPIGTAYPTRRVFITLGGQLINGYTVASATIGGVNATIHAFTQPSIDIATSIVISAVVPTGTTATVSTTFNAAFGLFGPLYAAAFTVDNLTVGTIVDNTGVASESDATLTTVVNEAANSAILAVVGWGNGSYKLPVSATNQGVEMTLGYVGGDNASWFANNVAENTIAPVVATWIGSYGASLCVISISPAPTTITTGTSPRGMCISQDGTSVYVTNSTGLSISQYSRNTSTGLLTALSPATVATGSTPYSVCISPDGTSVYVASAGTGRVYQYSRDTGSGLLTAMGTPYLAAGAFAFNVCVSSDGASVYVLNFTDSTISQYSRNVGTGELTALSPTTVSTGGAGSNPYGLSISSDGGFVYATNSVGNTIAEFSRNVGTGELTALSPATATIPTGHPGFMSIITPDGMSFYAINYTNGEVIQFTRNVASGQIMEYVPIVKIGTNPFTACISNDNKSIYVVNTGDNTISQFQRTQQ